MNLTKLLYITLFIFTFIGISACGGDDNLLFQNDFSTVPEPLSISGITPDTSSTGLITYNLKTGNGPFTVNKRDKILVYYTGRRTNGKVFDSSYKNSNEDPISLTVNSLVAGFQEGVTGMKEGGIRVFVIPPALGYANSGSSSLREDTLIFDVEIAVIQN